MPGLTTAYETKGITHFLMGAAGSTQAPDGALYLGLFTTAPANDGTGGVECSTSGGGYSRKAITFAASVNGQTANSGAITFTASASSPGFGDGVSAVLITHFGIFNAASAGTLLLYWPLTTSTTVGTGSSCTVAAGAITVGGPSNMTTAYKDKFLNHFFALNAQARDTAVYLGLYNAIPAADGTGGTECGAGWYARQAVTFGAPAGSPETISNSVAISFTPDASSDGGNIAYGTLHKNNTLADHAAGTMMMFYPFNTIFSAAPHSNINFPIGQISVTLD